MQDMCLGPIGRGIVRLWAMCKIWDAKGFPNHAEFYLYARDGGLAFRSVDIAGIGSTKSDLQIIHRGSAGGLAHAAPIVQLATLPGAANLVASLDSASSCHIWKLTDTSLAHTSSSFSYLTSLPPESDAQTISWVVGGTYKSYASLFEFCLLNVESTGKLLLASGANGIVAYDLVEEDKRDSSPASATAEIHKLGILEGSDHLGPLKQLHSVPSPRRVRPALYRWCWLTFSYSIHCYRTEF